MTPYIQKNVKFTKEQLGLVNSWTADMNSDSKAFFIHALVCQRQLRMKSDYEEWQGLPLPRATFIHVYCRDYQWEQVQQYMTRAPYSQEDGICFRYKVDETLIDEFIAAGETFLLSFSNIQHDSLFDIDGNRLNKLIRPFSSSPSTQIDIAQGINWLLREKRLLSRFDLTPVERERLRRRYLHNLNCFQGILERLTSIDYQKKQACYSQQLIQPDEGLRFYELGGGLQGASKNFREFLLASSPVLNVDAIKCHATIAHDELSKLIGDAPTGLEQFLNGSIIIDGCKLSLSTVKTAVLAVINGAKLVNKLIPSFTIPKLVLQDNNTSGDEKKEQLSLLIEYLRKVSENITTWVKTLPKHKRISTTSAYLQALEVKYLSPLKDIQSNDQHDGALVPIDIPSLSTGPLQVSPKPISTPDPYHSVPSSKGPLEFIPFVPGSIVDTIEATGARLIATNPELRKSSTNPHKNTDIELKPIDSNGLGWLFA